MRRLSLTFLVLCLLAPLPVLALEAIEVAVVANKFVTGSVDLARYYMERRGIPKENLVRIDTTNNEDCSREDYDEEIAAPVRRFLQERRGKTAIRCLVTVYGVPLRVGPPALTKVEQRELEGKRKELSTLRERLKALPDQKGSEAKSLQQQADVLNRQVRELSRQDQVAAVDSELALVLAGSYPLQNWVPNPYFLAFQQQQLLIGKDLALQVARLDGPSEATVRRMIGDSLAAEAKGLHGIAYFDARGGEPDAQKPLKGYDFYDKSLFLAARRLSERGWMKVVMDDKPAVFQPGTAPVAALYAGWYSHARYVDAFDWVPGAVGYHIASSECVSLRPGPSSLWCRRMLEDGAAAVIGPVAEPYVQAFPVPEAFFGLLADGYYTLAEAYFLSLPSLSWQMVLVGDPLYRPFKNRGL